MIHYFQNNGYNIALDAPSGAVHILSDVAYAILEHIAPPLDKKCPEQLYSSLSGASRNEIEEAYSDLYELYEDETLFSPDWDEKPELREYAAASKIVKSLCLHISHDCNMRCSYCFAGTGSYEHRRSLMSFETGKRAIDFLLEQSGPIKNLELDFFGGEPLLNFDVVKKLVEYGREAEKVKKKNIRFTITTNGTLLDDDAIAFINENMSNAVLSVDGRKCVNDSVRFYEDGSGTYDDILPKYKKLIESRTSDWYVRGTYTQKNKDFAADVLHLADAGFENISVEPVVLDADDPLALSEYDIPALCAEYDRLAAEMIRRNENGEGFAFFHFMIDLDAGPCVYKRVKGCGSGSEYIAVTPDGDLYPCHQFAGYPEYKMGNLYEKTFDKNIQSKFAGCNIMSMEHCKNCWAKYYCGGGCAANSYKFNKKLDGQYNLACILEKKRIECAMSIKAAGSERCGGAATF